MANISKIKLANNQTYNIRDNDAQTRLTSLESTVSGLSGAMKYIGVSTTDPKVSGATFEGHTNWVSGDVVVYGDKEFVTTGGNLPANWRELGDESSYATKTALENGLAGKADLTDGKVPSSQLPLTQLPIITTGGSGQAYTGTLNGITELTNGLTIIVIPHTDATIYSPTFNLNNLGAKGIRRYGDSATPFTVPSSIWFKKNKPMLLTYDGSYWIIINDRKPYGSSDFSNAVAVSAGGTGLGTLTANALYCGNGSNSPVAITNATVANSILTQGPSAAPVWTAPDTVKTNLGVTALESTVNGLGSFAFSDSANITFTPTYESATKTIVFPTSLTVTPSGTTSTVYAELSEI